MAEQFHACRFWPDCTIHLGDTPPRAFSAANAAQMAEDLADGCTLTEVAARFGCRLTTVARLTAGLRR